MGASRINTSGQLGFFVPNAGRSANEKAEEDKMKKIECVQLTFELAVGWRGVSHLQEGKRKIDAKVRHER